MYNTEALNLAAMSNCNDNRTTSHNAHIQAHTEYMQTCLRTPGHDEHGCDVEPELGSYDNPKCQWTVMRERWNIDPSRET